ncbi:SMI1/KNR4 family protein [Macrococcoides canis]|uniref:SMI1/KNR4 family protein n=1 Tax=Macrococcoides canis TaxID=1855823 RepID=UPI001AEBCE4B|nr:SMI1/KNR4 family protein [Macrococcus canis]QTQ07262.1 SMI1/KNR4 family protein [Macrococcus canis]
MNIKNLDRIDSNGDKVNLDDILQFEKWRGYKLPEDFIEFNLKFPGAYFEGEFDAVGRKNSLISNILLFSKDDEDSIYIDEAYGIKDFGPFVIFGEDPGGNFIAFDYSKDELNPSVVFIDHEELGVLELPDGTSENDFTEQELDRMMSSEKLEDFPWAIHFVSDSFTAFINNLTILNSSFTIKKNIHEFCIETFEDFLKNYKAKLPESYINFMKEYGGYRIDIGELNYSEHNFEITHVLNFNRNSTLNFENYLLHKGGKNRFGNLVPFLLVSYNSDIFDTSVICLKIENDNNKIVLIKDEILHNDKIITGKDEILLENDIDLFFKKITNLLKNK